MTWANRWGRRARVGAYAAAVALAGGWLAARAAHARLGEAALGLGRSLTHLGDLGRGAHRVVLNGETMYVAARTTDAELSAVLEGLRTECRERVGPIVQRRAQRQITVACLVRPPESVGASMIDRLRQFADTRDLSRIGLLRYGYARRTPAGRSHVVVVSTQGPLRLDRLLPARGVDAPGTEPAELPRPSQSWRVLSAGIEGAPHSLWLYQSPPTAHDVLSRYHRDLVAVGWRPVGGEDPGRRHGRAYVRSGDTLLVSADSDEGGTAIAVALSHDRGVVF